MRRMTSSRIRNRMALAGVLALAPVVAVRADEVSLVLCPCPNTSLATRARIQTPVTHELKTDRSGAVVGIKMIRAASGLDRVLSRTLHRGLISLTPVVELTRIDMQRFRQRLDPRLTTVRQRTHRLDLEFLG